MIFVLLIAVFTLSIPRPVVAGPQSTTYELKEYGFSGGGTTGVDSTSYSLFGLVGETEYGQLQSTNYSANTGLTFTIIAHVPAAPSFTNPSNNYDRLKFVIDNGGNPTDAKFAIGISSDDFVTTRYIQDDNTVGASLGSEDWQTYTNWGGASGEYVTGLTPGTTYKIKVKAKQGNFTETPWSATASVATVQPSLTFGVSADSITFDNLYGGNSWTDSSKSTVLTTSTNAYNGYTIYAHVTQALTFGATTIPNYAGTNASPTTWSGYGFGYNTSDTDLTGGTANRFSGSKYAGFITTATGDPVADHAGPVTTEISNEQFTISYRVTTQETQKAGTYNTTALYVVIPNY
ncbi:MAG: hypothetical protein UZ21_OP11001000938 [Microgenomates bacterium OLB22]|nr:MAG: hypothetical protein UZ21_OP11001000938 [Microgenomates bacterium OLB22]